MIIDEGNIVEYTDDSGYKVKGKVVLVYTSLAGNRCVHIDNYYVTRRIEEVTRISQGSNRFND